MIAVYKCTLKSVFRLRISVRRRKNEGEGRRTKETVGWERTGAFDDTAAVYRTKWLCLSVQLTWIKGCDEWKTNLALFATQLPFCPYFAFQSSPLPSLPAPKQISPPLPVPPVSQLICNLLGAVVPSLCVAFELHGSPIPRCLFLCSR